jgi:large subunit ribosomal protein L29
MLAPEELKELMLSDLSEKEKELRKELFNLRFQRTLGQMQNPMRMREVRHDIARIMTFMKMKGAGK